jgi:hypothetical protein
MSYLHLEHRVGTSYHSAPEHSNPPLLRGSRMDESTTMKRFETPWKA